MDGLAPPRHGSVGLPALRAGVDVLTEDNVTQNSTYGAVKTSSTATARLNLSRRPRRLRRTEAIRAMVRETRLTPDTFVYPLFVCEGRGVRRPISSMPGVSQLSVDEAVREADAAAGEGIRAVMLFGLPSHKDAAGSQASATDAPVQEAIRALKRAAPALVLTTDVCLCEYTSHGHCGIVEGDEIVNDATVERLVETALSHAAAGADFVVPSDMMDGRVGAIRTALDERGFDRVGIMSHAVKYCSGFYGPFREAVDSTPQFGDRRSHQMDPANVEEALREVEIDLAEGADVVTRVKTRFGQPTAAYQVSGEYSMIKAAAERGWIDEDRAVLETLTGIRRAGADLIVTYFARHAARLLA